MPGPDPDRWLTEYVVGRLREAGVHEDIAAPVARKMSADIAAAFATLHRVDVALDRAGVDWIPDPPGERDYAEGAIGHSQQRPSATAAR